MAIESGRTAVIVVVPEAQELVERGRLLFDSAGLLGLPPHVTILYPFIREEDLTDDVLAGVQEIFAEQPAFDVEFVTTTRFEGGLIYLPPEPAKPFRTLTDAFVRRWPEHPPYRGDYDDVTPHLTLLEPESAELAERFQADARDLLPIRTRVVQAELIGFDGERWRTLVEFPLKPTS